jgi:proteasome accessory factor B
VSPQVSNASKTERLLNLLIMLLVQRNYVSKERIRAILYADASDDAFEKMFERDKEELRSLGVPIEVGQMDAYFDDEPGYRVRADQFALPEISLESDEASVVALATKVWEHARLAEATTDAVSKLSAAGLALDLGALDIAQPRLSADEPAFDVFWEATVSRRAVTFDYQRPGYDAPLTRHLQPWGVVRFSGRWYAVGLDTDRGQERVFRLSRVVGAAKAVGSPGAFDIPPGTDVREGARRLAPTAPSEEAVVLVRPGAGVVLRRAAASVEPDVVGPDDATPWDRLVLPSGAQADELLALGADVYVERPASLRDEVVARLRAAAGVPA